MSANKSVKHPLLRIAVAALIVTVAAGSIAIAMSKRQQNTASQHGQLRVVAAENFWGNIASQIGGDHVHVTSIISDPQADPHLYESSATNASEVSRADVIIINGLGYDDFMDKLLSGSPNNQRQVVRAADVLGIKNNDANPHLWYDIPRIHEVSDTIAARFESKDPAHKADYQANARKFARSLQPLVDQIQRIKQADGGKSVAYTEPVPGYLLAAAGLDNKTPQGFSKSIEDGSDPSPADTQAMDALFTDRSVKALLYNSQATSAVTQKVQDLAKQNNIAVVGVTETLPPQFKTYQAWQQSQLDAIQNAVQTP